MDVIHSSTNKLSASVITVELLEVRIKFETLSGGTGTAIAV
jgi:hypothetical protein